MTAPFGLSTEDAERRLAQCGHNELPERRTRSFLANAAHALAEPMFALLLVAAAIYLFLGDRVEALFLGASVIAIFAITIYQQHKTERVLAALRDLSSPRADGGYLPATYMDTYFSAIQESGEKVLDNAVSVARKTGVDVDPAMARARSRTVAHAILDHAKKSKADVIVLGTHGRRGLRRVLVGSDAEAVVREAAVPVLLVRGASTRRRSMRKPESTARGGRRRTVTVAASA